MGLVGWVRRRKRKTRTRLRFALRRGRRPGASMLHDSIKPRWVIRRGVAKEHQAVRHRKSVGEGSPIHKIGAREDGESSDVVGREQCAAICVAKEQLQATAGQLNR